MYYFKMKKNFNLHGSLSERKNNVADHEFSIKRLIAPVGTITPSNALMSYTADYATGSDPTAKGLQTDITPNAKRFVREGKEGITNVQSKTTPKELNNRCGYFLYRIIRDV